MSRILYARLAALLVTFIVATQAQAQIFTPTYTSPRLVDEFGITVSDAPGSLAIEGIWRGGPLGVRVGYADAADGLLSIGGELRSPVLIEDAPLGLAFTAGAQGLIGDGNAVGLHGGLSAGYTFMTPGIGFTPYLHPRLGFVNDRGMDSFEVRALADVGVDAEFYNNLLVRLGVSLADVGANWGVGVGWRR
jgi:hypothetical protein